MGRASCVPSRSIRVQDGAAQGWLAPGSSAGWRLPALGLSAWASWAHVTVAESQA